MEDRDEIRNAVFWGSVALHSVLSTCDRLRTACGIVKDKRLRGVGYNGSVSGLPHCDDEGHMMESGHCIATRHGEVNAISNTAREDLRGGQALITATPCIDCVKDLCEEGVSTIEYAGTYENAKGMEYLKKLTLEKGVSMQQHDIDWADLFQELFDLLARKGGVLYRAGYRLKITKEPIE